MRKYYWLITALAAFVTGIAAFSSCQNSSNAPDQPPPLEYAAPVVQPLVPDSKKFNWDSIKSTPAHPVVKPFDLNKLPAQSYDTAGLKPFKYPVEEAKLDINTLPERDLDVDMIASRPLKFTTEQLPPPKLIHAGPPHLKDPALSLFELADAQNLMGTFVLGQFIDRDGFLWMASATGVYRYDGENLLLYFELRNSSDASQYIFGMQQDASGAIWMATEGAGLEVLYPKAGILKKTDKSMGLSNNDLFQLMIDSRQKIWLSSTGTGRGINIIDPKTQTVKWLDGAHGLADTAKINQVVQDGENRLWIASDNGIKIIDPANKKIRFIRKANGLSSDSVSALFFDRAGGLWIGYFNGILDKLDLQKNTIQAIKEIQSPANAIFGMLEDKKGELWVNADKSGVEIIARGRRLATNLKNSLGPDWSAVSHLNRDNRGQVWISSYGGGVNMMSDNRVIVKHIGETQTACALEDDDGLIWQGSFAGIDILDRKAKTRRHFGVKQGLSNNAIQVIKKTNGNMLISSGAGLDIVNPAMKTITHFGKNEGLSSSLESGAEIDRSGRIWMASTNEGLDVFDPASKSLKHLKKIFSDPDLQDIKQDTHGRIWVSSATGGVYIIDPATGTVQNLKNQPGLKSAVPKILMPDSNGAMWIGTGKGIYIADLKNKKLTSFSTPQGLIDERVISLIRHDGAVYAGTNKGITEIHPPAPGAAAAGPWISRSFGKAYGLSKINVGFYETDMMTNDGLYWWGDNGFTVLDFSKKETYIPPAFVSGLNIMDQPAIFVAGPHAAANGPAWDGVEGPFNMPAGLVLPHDQNYLQFNFVTLNYAANDTTWYRYKLVGKDTGWSAKTTLEHSRNYFGLAPGKYRFEVTAKTSGDGWSNPAAFGFTITPAWWQTWWACLLYVLFFCGIIWGFVTFRSYQLVKEKRLLEHKVQLRTEEVMQQKEEIEAQRDNLEKSFKELKTAQTQLVQSEKMASLGELTAGIAHEIQNPLNFVNNFSEVNAELIDELQQEIENGNYDEVKAISGDIKQNQQKISQHGKRADFIVKGMLQHSRNSTGERQLTNINVLADEFFKLSYHGLRAKDKSFNAEMTTHFDENLPNVNIVQQDIGRVLLNLFNNAFYAINQKAKTAGAAYKPEVMVTTVFENGNVVVRVKDNGTGIPDAIKEKIMQPFFTTKPTGEGTGLGLSLSYDMVVKGHGGSISVTSKEREGSEFVITLPIS